MNTVSPTIYSPNMNHTQPISKVSLSLSHPSFTPTYQLWMDSIKSRWTRKQLDKLANQLFKDVKDPQTFTTGITDSLE